jgi:hypothetical protein
VRAADDDAPFSDSMLQWLEEGDRLADAAHGGARPSGAHHPLESPRRRERMFVVGGLVLAGVLVLVLRLSSGKKSDESQTHSVTATSVAPVPTAASSTQVALAPAQAAAEAPAALAPSGQPVAAAAPAAAPVAVPSTGEAQAPTPPPASAASAPAAVVPAVDPAPPPAAAIAAAPPSVHAAVEPARPALALGEPKAAAAAPAVPPADFATAIADCRANMTAGRIQRAVTACRQATDAQPRSSEALTLLAEAEFTRGHTGVALKLATSATNANQNFADAYVIIGGVYQEKGKNAEARAAYEAYLSLQPKGKHAADLRAILSSLQ